MKTSPLMLSATDLAIAAAIRAGTLRLERCRSPRLGNDYVAISDAVGMIEVALTEEEARTRVAAIARSSGDARDGAEELALVEAAFARGVRVVISPAAAALDTARAVVRSVVGPLADAMQAAIDVAKVDNADGVRGCVLHLISRIEEATKRARAAEVVAGCAQAARSEVPPSTPGLRIADVLDAGSPLAAVVVRTINVTADASPVEEFRGALLELVGENGDDAALDAAAIATARDGISRELVCADGEKRRIEVVPAGLPLPTKRAR